MYAVGKPFASSFSLRDFFATGEREFLIDTISLRRSSGVGDVEVDVSDDVVSSVTGSPTFPRTSLAYRSCSTSTALVKSFLRIKSSLPLFLSSAACQSSNDGSSTISPESCTPVRSF